MNPKVEYESQVAACLKIPDPFLTPDDANWHPKWWMYAVDPSLQFAKAVILLLPHSQLSFVHTLSKSAL